MSPVAPRPSRRVRVLTAGAALALTAGLAAALPSPAAAVEAGRWSTSFEAGDPAGVATRVERDADGAPVRFGVSAPDAPAPGAVTSPGTTVAASADNGPGTGPAALLDDDDATRWQARTRSADVTVDLGRATAVSGYTLTSAADAPDRDPATWTLLASTDGTRFTPADTRTAQTFDARGLTRTFALAAPTTARWYRLAVASPRAGDVVQLAGLSLTGTTAAADPGPMVTTTGTGPTEAYTAKQNVGFTGLKAYRYAGRQSRTDSVYETNVVTTGLAVPIGPDSRLSYRIFPESTVDGNEYASTYAAIDLHFTDGTTLSQLRPVDQHGVGATAAAQGDGKILYLDQWNQESVDLGAVAAGRTVDRVLLAYADPSGVTGTAFSGWVDDLVIDPAPPAVDTSTLAAVVDTRRGTNSNGSFSRGNNLPISAVPNGFTFLTPVTDASSNSWEYYYQQANDAQNHPMLQGLSVSHEPSPWMGDRNQLSVMPSPSSTPTGSPTGRALAFTHDAETARPDQYAVRFLNGMKAELAPTDHGSVMRFTFTGKGGSLVFDTVDRNGRFVVDRTAGTVSGWVDNGSGLSAGRSRMFFVGTFDAPVVATGTAAGANAATSQYATFTRQTVELRLATSFIGLAQARRNAGFELSGRTFDQIRDAATAAWQARLGVVSVGGATDDQLRTLYGSLYRLNLYPNSQFENTGSAATPRYRYASPVLPSTGAPSDTVTSAAVRDGKVYVNNGFWDTYRTVWPAYSLLYPDVAAELVDGFTQQYRDGGWIARWSSPGYADLMTGTSSDVAFADAYLKGVPLVDPLATYDAALRNASATPTQSGVGRKGITTSLFRKYTDTGTGESVSWGLEGAINDAGLAKMAAALADDPRTPAARRAGLRDDAAWLADRSGQYVNLFDPAVGFFQGRNADGSFAQSPADYDPESWGGVYTETDGWNFAFHAPQDGQGLADLYGGRAGLAAKLDTFFSTPELANKPGGYGGVIHEMVEARAVRMGQFGMSNQVSHHIPYMYLYAQQPWKTQAKVREVLQRLYVGSEIGQGYPGDEDNGEMSAWYVLSSLGLYPLQVGSPNWAIGSPLFPSVTVHRPSGDLTITARNQGPSNVYVQSMTLNGASRSATSISAGDLAGATDLGFVMGSSPSTWGSGAADVPPSPTTGATPPAPQQDATTPAVGRLTANDGTNVAALVDDDQTTEVAFDAVPTLTWRTTGAAQTVDRYTITSGSTPGSLRAWRLQGSDDGRTWTTLDTRSGQQFTWRGQTRPFSVATPAAFRQYRIVPATGQKAALGEIELLVAPGATGVAKLVLRPAGPIPSGRVGSPVGGTLATFLAARGASPSSYSGRIDWGDGSTSAATLTPGQLGSVTVSGTHRYAAPGPYRVAVTVTGDGQSAVATLDAEVAVAATGGITRGFDSVCIADDGTAVNCDGVGYSYSRQALAAAGAVQGATVTVPGTGLHVVLPPVAAGQPDNAAGNGQTVPVTLPADATRIAFVGAGTQGDQQATATLRFSDGTSRQVPMDFPDWTLGGGGQPVPDGFTAVAASAYRLAGGSRDGARPYLFAGPAIELPAGKTLTGVTMPDQPGGDADGRVHLFGVADDGTVPAALAAQPGPAATAATGTATALTLARVSGGGRPVTARVQWGDETVTEDATVTVRNGVPVVTGRHTWTAPGRYTVRVTVSDDARSATTGVTVTVSDAAPVTLAAAPTAVAPGAPVTLSGAGFVPGETVALTLAGASAPVVADASGRVTGTLTVPAGLAADRYAAAATGASTRTAVTGVDVADPAALTAGPSARSTLVLSTTTAQPGEQVDVQGAGYRPGSDVAVIGAGSNGVATTLVVLRSNADGVVAGAFTVPAGGLTAVTTTNAAATDLPPARSPFAVAAAPRGTAG